jgi:hypothetical protein
MRYIIAILVAFFLMAAFFGIHWLISNRMERMEQDARKQLGVGPEVDVKIKIPRSLAVMFSLEELLYSLWFVLFPSILATCLIVARVWPRKG